MAGLIALGGGVRYFLPFDEWTVTFGEERLTGALLDRPTHHAHILQINGQPYRLAQSRSKRIRLTRI